MLRRIVSLLLGGVHIEGGLISRVVGRRNELILIQELVRLSQALIVQIIRWEVLIIDFINRS